MKVGKVASLDGRIKILRDLTAEGIRHPIIRSEAAWLVSDCPDRSDGCEIAKVFWYVKGNVRYTGDIAGIDTYQVPWRTLQLRAGDCDDASVLICAMLAAIGFQVGFRVISTTGQVWEHIYALIGVPKLAPTHVVPLDDTVPNSVPGWEPPHPKVVKDYFPLKLV